VLNGGCLLSCHRTIDVSNATLTYQVENLLKNQFEICTPGRMYYLQASSREAMFFWLEALQVWSLKAVRAPTQCLMHLAGSLVPGLLTPPFVTCNTNAGEGLVKLSHVQWRTFCTAGKRLSEPKKCCQDCLISSAQSFYSLCLQSVAHSLTCCFSGNVPLLHSSRYVTTRDSVHQV